VALKEFQLSIDGIPDAGDETVAALIAEAAALR
jgi:hypothetical protein